MPWALTTPLNTGDLDTGAYAEVKIVAVIYRKDSISVDLEYGNTVDGNWAKGHLPVGKERSHLIIGEKYDTLVAHVTLASELTWDAVKRGLYNHLAAEGIIDPGGVV